jgi:hypothetical protein
MESATDFVRDGSGRSVAGVDYPRTFQEMDEWFRTGAVAATVTSLGARQVVAHEHHAAHHHSEREHVHHAAREHPHSDESHDSHYHHRHDDYDDHHHNCVHTGEVDPQTRHSKQECRDHEGILR